MEVFVLSINLLYIIKIGREWNIIGIVKCKMGTIMINVIDVGKCYVNEILKKKIIIVIFKFIYFDFKKK